MRLKNPGIRLGLACLVAASAGLSLAIISISKILLVIAVLPVLLWGKKPAVDGLPLQKMWAPLLAVVIVFAFAISLLWTSAPMDQALGALGKYGKFLVIPALLVLIRTRQEASYVLVCFLGAQVFLMTSSWLLYFHVPLVWATSNMALDRYAVFSSYLDQGIMSAVVAAMFWHLKTLASSKTLYYIAIALSLLALGNVFVVFVGRTGYVVGVVVVSLATFWVLPRRYRLVALLVPPLLLVLAFFSIEKVAQRVSFTQGEVSAFSAGNGAATSTDNRLDFWKGSVNAIVANPLAGTGVGSWATTYNKIQQLKYPGHKDLTVGGNPHQEFLLWGVQLGVGGVMLLLAFLSAVMLDLRKMDTPIVRAGLSVLVALAISCLFNSSLYDAYIGDFFCLSLGVLLAYGARSRYESQGQPQES
jgi:O-antigen ligase